MTEKYIFIDQCSTLGFLSRLIIVIIYVKIIIIIVSPSSRWSLKNLAVAEKLRDASYYLEKTLAQEDVKSWSLVTLHMNTLLLLHIKLFDRCFSLVNLDLKHYYEFSSRITHWIDYVHFQATIGSI